MHRTDAPNSLRFVKRLCVAGRLSEAVEVLEDICRQNRLLSAEALLEIVRGCFRKKDLASGRRVRALISRCGFESDQLLNNHLIRLFCAGGKLPEALQQFENHPTKDDYAWNTLISAYAKHKKGQQAIDLYYEMTLSSVKPDSFTYAAVLKACASIASLEQGRMIHSHILATGLGHDPLVGNSLVDMYCKCGSLTEAREVFLNLPKRDIVSWNAMIVGCVQQTKNSEAFQLYEQMQDEGLKPDTVTYLFMLKACRNMGALALDQGRIMHTNITKRGLGGDPFLGSSLIDMYVKCGSLDEAHQVFGKLQNRDLFVWTSMIAGCAEYGLGEKAFHLFQVMMSEGLKPDKFILVSILKAFCSIKELSRGKIIHAHILEKGFESDIYVASALVGMYAKCGSIDEAHKLFLKLPQRDIVLWNTMITGFVQQERGQDALNLFERMQKEGLKPDNFTISSICKACCSISALDQGKHIHKQLAESGLGFDVVVGNSLIDMYVKCGSIDDARIVFLSLHKRDVVSWTSMIGGFAEVGNSEEAFTLFKKMQEEGLKPNKVTFICVLKACSSLSTLGYGKMIHAQVKNDGLETDLVIGNALVDMYAKCGSIHDARQAFLKLSKRDVISWNAMIDGCAQQGFGKASLYLFDDMQQDGVVPNEATFVSVLTACSHTGLVSEGYSLFQYMHKELSIKPEMQHYACMVDLLGRAGRLYEAHDFIMKMPMEPTVVVWMSLLGACRTHSNLELGRRSFESILKLDPKNVVAQSLMSNIYDLLADQSTKPSQMMR